MFQEEIIEKNQILALGSQKTRYTEDFSKNYKRCHIFVLFVPGNIEVEVITDSFGSRRPGIENFT
jgi:hypothetical protein